ncbi:hypothetical protein [Halegenticoccus tardaugens]|uniref:hypothetical protein n=1 Tax=Halegenticoccus tardaugens TaxID=2071624 RepID=UPI00100C30A9|nr:hypothetical protein [Halegenticoccus tardaugens]
MSRYSATPSIAVTETERLPTAARVRSFDELSDAAKDRILARTEGIAGDLGPLPDDLREDDVVVFTRYYRVVAS